MDDRSTAEEQLPEDLLDAVRSLDERELWLLVEFAHRRIQVVHPSISEQIEERERQEVIQVSEENGLARVLRREPASDAREREEVLVLYLVTEERTPDGETNLHWRYLGPVRD